MSRKKYSDEISDVIKANKAFFEDVARIYGDNNYDIDDWIYSCLDYSLILRDMNDFIEGYIEYRDQDSPNKQDFTDKTLKVTVGVYQNMFVDKKYRLSFSLYDYPKLNASYLEAVKAIQETIDKYEEDDTGDLSLKQILLLTNNNILKLNKVVSDDMKIFLWQVSVKHKSNKRTCGVDLRVQFMDKRSPVMHRIK